MFEPVQPRTLSMSSEGLPTWGGQPVLFPVALEGTEALGKLYRYELDVATVDSPTLGRLSAQEKVKPDELIGKTLAVGIESYGKGPLNAGAGVRTIEGIITAVKLTSTDDRHAYYRFVIKPWLSLAKNEVRTRIFQNLNVVELTEAVFADMNYVFGYELRLGAMTLDRVYPVREYVRQAYESNYAFLSRVWRSWGITYYFDGLKLILCDSPGAHHPHGNAYDTIRYHAPEGERFDEEHITQLSDTRRITPGAVDLVDYDYTQSNAKFEGGYSRSTQSSYDNARQEGWGHFSQPLAGAMGLSGQHNDFELESEHFARVKVEAMRSRARRIRGRGNLAGLMTGHTFHLIDHPSKPVNQEYLVVETHLKVRNVVETTVRTAGDGGYECVTDFVLQPFGGEVFFRNRPKKKPVCLPETAVVVGPANQPLWLDGYARVKVLFKWDRNTPADDQASCWVRTASPWMGYGHGFIANPRIGDEVTIEYHEGDPDKPYISARHVNQFNPPPWTLPGNESLSGMLSRSLDGRGHNQIVADDTPGKLQVQLTSDQANSRLALGYNTRVVPFDGRKQARGEGFELASDGDGVVRANRSLLITTEARSGASAPMKDMGETLMRLTGAHTLHEALAKLAQQCGAQDAQASQAGVVSSIQSQNTALRGHATPDNPFPEMSEPHLALSSPVGIEASTAGSLHLAADTHVAMTAGKDVGVATGGSFFGAVRGALSWFVQQLGIKLIAAAGRIDIQAQSDAMALAAQKAITLQTPDTITLTAGQKLVIQAGSTRVEIGDGFRIFTGGQFDVHAASHDFEGPQPQSVNVPPFTTDKMASTYIHSL